LHIRVSTKKKITKKPPPLSNGEKNELIITFGQYWQSLWSPSNRVQLNVTHDMYLKAYSEAPYALPHDILVVDEYQDLNDAMISLIDKLSILKPSMKTIKLGDPCQQIYHFKGASSSFSTSKFHYRLDESHRFGRGLCNVINSFMDSQQLNYYTKIRSRSNATKVEQHKSVGEIIELAKMKKYPTIIARNNSTLWYMVKNIALSGLKCHLVGNNQKELYFLRALFELKSGRKTNHPALRGTTFSAYVNNAKLNKNTSALLASKFVSKIEGDDLFSKIEASLTEAKNADVNLTTAHQAKGLEFNHVIMANDFSECVSDSGEFVKISTEDAHLIYTAMSRARLSLTLPKSWVGLSHNKKSRY